MNKLFCFTAFTPVLNCFWLVLGINQNRFRLTFGNQEYWLEDHFPFWFIWYGRLRLCNHDLSVVLSSSSSSSSPASCSPTDLLSIYYRPQRSCKGYVFTGVCLSTGGGGGGVSGLVPGVPAPGGVCSWGGGACSGRSALGGCLLWGVSALGVCLLQGVCLL